MKSALALATYVNVGVVNGVWERVFIFTLEPYSIIKYNLFPYIAILQHTIF